MWHVSKHHWDPGFSLSCFCMIADCRMYELRPYGHFYYKLSLNRWWKEGFYVLYTCYVKVLVESTEYQLSMDSCSLCFCLLGVQLKLCVTL